ncbi:hypothetical protein [Photobacterium lutimaris]|uniref:Porin n=1 Tax=Photobacterium lutimaris TaxID=388278 RepID=A0A2T3J106_9GAMM|nr:hypothetical protein [Photobacterium lutimaris]PSU34761.1 hypothetical protein C9I99_06610 [Photobacterium lutimaris]TDR77084.1 hypothetical protein DFP78_10291 [Photobacterium lutimaris]
MKSSKTLLSVGLAAAMALSATTVAADEVHDADPRNTAWRGGIATDNNGEIKLVAGGGFNNLYGGGDYTTQTIMIGEYFTQSENFRFRLANFDERFGGVYADVNLTEGVDFYTAGYMLPLTATNGTTLFFPSVNYSYVDFDTAEIANGFNEQASNSALGGYSMGSNSHRLQGADVKHLLGGDHAHVASVNLYGLQPWNDTHYTVFQAFGGSSYGGVDMQMVDLVLLQGMRTQLGDAVFNIYLEGKYTNIKVNDVNDPTGNVSHLRGEETKVSVGFDWRF